MNTLTLKKHLEHYALGELIKITPLIGGTVNSNYLIETTQGQWVFTVLEAMPNGLAGSLCEFLLFLNHHAFSTPIVQKTRFQEVLIDYEHKPSLIVSYLSGQSPIHPTLKQCHDIGQTLGQLHQLTKDYPYHLTNTMGDLWRINAAQELMSQLSPQEQTYIQATLEAQKMLPELPKGIIHFDLFRDNTLFIEDRLQGVIDFYYACYDTYLIDLSIAINDWCTNWKDPDRHMRPDNLQALMAGYQNIRPLTALEHQILPTMLKISALHFWLTRSLSHKKDPDDYKKIFLNHLLKRAD